MPPNAPTSSPPTPPPPPITPPEEFYFPIPYGTVTPETLPLLENQRHHLRTHSSTTHLANPFINRPHHKNCPHNRHMKLWSAIFQLQIFCAILFILSFGMIMLMRWGSMGVKEKDNKKKEDVESPDHYNNSMPTRHRTGPDNPMLVTPRVQTIDKHQLRDIDFAILCFIVVLAASIVTAVGHFMGPSGGCIGCDESEMNSEVVHDEDVDERWTCKESVGGGNVV